MTSNRKSKGKCYGCGIKFFKYSTWIWCNKCERENKVLADRKRGISKTMGITRVEFEERYPNLRDLAKLESIRKAFVCKSKKKEPLVRSDMIRMSVEDYMKKYPYASVKKLIRAKGKISIKLENAKAGNNQP